MSRIQSLWSGYGELLRVPREGTAGETNATSAVVKWVRPPALGEGESALETASHERKLRSYDVETAFYRMVAPRCDDTCRVARLYEATVGDGEWRLVMEDLDEAGFARRTRDPRGPDLHACLGWLASFHARFLGEDAAALGLWSVGTYWHLGTRRDELRAAARDDPALPARASELDRRLRAARFPTIVHGAAKPANFCFSPAGGADLKVAAVDFQYCGGGPGVVDVAYLVHGAAPREMAAALDGYFGHLGAAVAARSPAVDRAALEAEGRELFPVALADFERFLVGWRR